MKKAGPRMVARALIAAMCCSTSYLLSKCGTPVWRSAEFTEGEDEVDASGAGGVGGGDALSGLGDWLSPPNGVVIANSGVAPSSAVAIADESSSEAATSVAPALASAFAAPEPGSRVTARTLWPRASSRARRRRPASPVDPVTTTVSSCAMGGVIRRGPASGKAEIAELSVPCTGQSRSARSSSS